MSAAADVADAGEAEAGAPIPAPLWARTPDEALAALIQLLTTQHAGKARGICAEALARQLCVHERMLRTLVSRARLQGIAISATPDTGYYVAQTAEEIEESCNFLRSRAMSSLAIEAQLRRVPLAELLGQTQLKLKELP